MKRRALYILLLVAAVAGVLFIVRSPLGTRVSSAGSIPPRGGTPMNRLVLKAEPIHLQTDPRWSESKLGGSGERFGSVGCAVCCVSMGLAQFGINLRPDSLNGRLERAGGFTDQGWLKWEAVEDVTDGRASIRVIDAPEFAHIDRALSDGEPVLAKVLISGRIAHWVLIVGKSGLDYLIKDPLGDGRTLNTLAEYRSDIHAIRIVSKEG